MKDKLNQALGYLFVSVFFLWDLVFNIFIKKFIKGFFLNPEEIPKEVAEMLGAIDFGDASYFNLNNG